MTGCFEFDVGSVLPLSAGPPRTPFPLPLCILGKLIFIPNQREADSVRKVCPPGERQSQQGETGRAGRQSASPPVRTGVVGHYPPTQVRGKRPAGSRTCLVRGQGSLGPSGVIRDVRTVPASVSTRGCGVGRLGCEAAARALLLRLWLGTGALRSQDTGVLPYLLAPCLPDRPGLRGGLKPCRAAEKHREGP